MKILIVNTYYYPEIIGGAEYSVKKLAEELFLEGHEVFVLCTSDTDSKEVINGVTIHRVRTKHLFRVANGANKSRFARLIRSIQDIWNPKNIKIINKIVTTIEPDVIHTNGLFDISPVVWKIGKKNNVKVIHTLRDYMMCCPIVSLECSNGLCPSKIGRVMCPFHRLMNRIHTKYVDVVTAPSAFTLSKVCSLGFFKKSKSVVVPNAIDYNDKDVLSIADKKIARKSSTLNFVYLGTLSPKKGILSLLTAFQDITDDTCELWIAGKGELEKEVTEASTRNKRIHYLGFLNENEVNGLMKTMDVLICPSLWNEPFGRVVLDAYKNATPVICSDRGALPSLVIEGKTGLIYSANDINGLKESICYFSKNKNVIAFMIHNVIEELKKYSVSLQCKMFVEKVYN